MNPKDIRKKIRLRGKKFYFFTDSNFIPRKKISYTQIVWWVTGSSLGGWLGDCLIAIAYSNAFM